MDVNHIIIILTLLVLYVQVAATNWIGWLVYGITTLVAFLTLKIVNIRLHQSLGNDPPPPVEEDTPLQEESEDEKLEDKGEYKTSNYVRIRY